MDFRKFLSRVLCGWRMVRTTVLFIAATAITLPAQTFTSLASFDGTNGSQPFAALAQGFNGNLYGTTSAGGVDANGYCPYSFLGCGTAFEITNGGALTSLYSFCSVDAECSDGWVVYAGLLQATNGALYGATFAGGTGGAGTIFKISAGDALTTVHNFDTTDGAAPGGLVPSLNRNFYGTTKSSGTYGYGTVFTVSPTGALTTLHTFDNTDGSEPNRVIQGTDGNIYGTTAQGGDVNCRILDAPGCGTIFKMTAGGALTTLYTFCSQANCTDGASPTSLIQATDGNFYGTTYGGGNSACDSDGFIGCGTVFKITTDGALTTIFTFCQQSNCTSEASFDGSHPAALLQATDGNLYGVTETGGDLKCGLGFGCGTIFEITSGGKLRTIHSFKGVDGDEPSGLMQATSGTLYGTTINGGAAQDGTVFSMSVGLGPFVAFARDAGKIGQSGPILGQGFTGTTGVFLNGTPARFIVVSDTYIQATVPAGATTGYVTVNTPSGTLTSNVPFHVIP